MQKSLNTTGALFEKNLGQWDSRALFRVHADGYDAFITRTGLAMVQTQAPNRTILESGNPHEVSWSPQPIQHWATLLSFEGSNPAPLVTTDFETPYHTNYLIGNNPLLWHTDVPNYRQVKLSGIYPGIDLVYHNAQNGALKYDFIVHPGANPDQIRQRFTGQSNLQTNPDGSLSIETGLGTIRQEAPLTRQADGLNVSNNYILSPGGALAFSVGPYDANQDLIIDPLVYSTFVGGGGSDYGESIALDSSGNAYITGDTTSTNYPTHSGAYDTAYDGGYDVVVSKLNSAGSALVYSTYLGGSGFDSGKEISVDASGNAYVFGETSSSTYPTTSGAYDTTYNGATDVFVTKLNSVGSGFVYSTFLGGSSQEYDYGLAVDSSGNAYLTGGTGSSNYPTTSGAYDTTHNGNQDIFVTKLNSAGSGLVYSTVIGGDNFDYGYGIAVDSSGNAYIIRSGGIAAKLNPAGSALVYSTLLGGGATAIAVDSSGNAYIIGQASSSFTATSGAYDTTYNGGNQDVFATKLSAAGAVVYATFLGGGVALHDNWAAEDLGDGIAVDSSGNAYLTGYTSSADFPTTSGAYDTTPNEGDVFVTKLNAAGSSVVYSTFLGGSSTDNGNGIVVDSSGDAYVTGYEYYSGYPTTSGAYDTTQNGGSDAFVTKFSFNPPNAPVSLVASCGSPRGVYLTWSAGSGPLATGYKVYRSPDGASFTAVGSPSSASYTDVPAWRTTAYVYRVTATNDVGESPSSSTVSFSTCDSQSPTVAGNPSAVAWTNSPTVSGVAWSDTYSGLQSNAEYSVGTTNGATDVSLGWTSMPAQHQPANGASTWTPSWSPAPLGQGMNYVNVRVRDQLGNLLTTDGAYTVQYETAAPSISGNPQAYAWRKTLPAMSGVSWSDGLSGLQNTVQYSIGTTSGGTNVVGWTNLPVQPSSGQTTPFSPTWTPPTLAQGMNYVSMRVTDRAGNQLQTSDAYTVQYETQQPEISGNPSAITWTNTIPTLNAVSWRDTVAGLQNNAQYSVGTASGSTNVLGWTALPVQPNSGHTGWWNPSWSPNSTLAQGKNYVNTRIFDVAGNQLQTNGAYTIQYETNAPSVTGAPSVRPWNNFTATGVTWQDPLSGLRNNAQYSVGSTTGGSDIQGWTSIPAQPSNGQTTAWSPTWNPFGSFLEGSNYVNTRINSVAGNQVQTDGGYVIRYDAVPPHIAGAPQAVPWTNTPPTFNAVTWQDFGTGLQNTVQYSVGDADGPTGEVGLTYVDMPTQPTSGQTSAWTPSWSPPASSLAQGLNFINTRVSDTLGHQLSTHTAYTVQYDTALPTASGNPQAVAWRNSLPTLAGVSWQDVRSGLQNSVQYSVGTTSGATDVLAWNALPVQPPVGQTTAWNPSWSPSTLGQGMNYVNLRVTDQAGNLLQTNGAYTVQYDSLPATVSGNPQAFAWRNTFPTLSGVSWQDVTTGLQSNVQYSIGTASGSTNVLGWTTLPAQPTSGQTTTWAPSWMPSALTQGMNYVNTRVTDVVGNVVQTNSAYTVQYQTSVPTVMGAPATLPWNAVTASGVTWSDSMSGLQNNALYSVGVTSGGTTIQPWTSVPSGSQPSVGQASWAPAFAVGGTLPQGLSYVNARVSNVAGNQLQTNGAYIVRTDTQLPAIAGVPQTIAWTRTLPSLGGVSWQDATSGLQVIQYSVGSTAGATDVSSGWVNLATQPPSGTTGSWSPAAWSPSALAQGTNYVNLRAIDVAGNVLTTNSAYTVQYDTQSAAVSGNPQALSWTNSMPTFNGVTWQDSTSGLAATVQYTIGSTSGGTDVVLWTALPTQPTVGQTTSWTPSWSPNSLAQGMNYISLRVTDRAGNQLQTSDVYTVNYQTSAPIVTGAPTVLPWGTLTLSGVNWQDAASGLQTGAQYSVGSTSGATDLGPWTAIPVQPTGGQTNAWSPAWSYPGTPAQGPNYVNTKLNNVAGNQAQTSGAYVVRYDTQLPTVTGSPQTVTWSRQIPLLSGVSWQDATSGLQSAVEYSVGTNSGAADTTNWTTLPVQPTAAQTSLWTPSWSPSTFAQGLNYVNVRVADQAGNMRTTNGAYTVQYDTVVPSVSGDGLLAWSTTAPSLTATLQDARSGLTATAQYSIGSTSGATDVLGWTSLPTQPTAGQTSPFSASWTPTASLVPGLNYVNVRVTDQAGNVGQTNGASVIRFDTSAPSTTGNPHVMPWSETVPTVSGVSWQDTMSGLQNTFQYSIGSTIGATNLKGWTTLPTQPAVGQTTAFSPSWTPTATLVEGQNYVNIRADDTLGNRLETAGAYVIRIDTQMPAITGNPITTEWRSAPGSIAGVSWQSVIGLDGNAQYSIGSTNGATDVLAWTDMPVQPEVGQTTPFNPTWSPAGSLHQGLNYVNTRVSDIAGGGYLETSGAYVIRYDTALPTSSGLTTMPWSATATATGVTWQDAASGLQASMQYSVGSTAGATDIVAWTALSVQPSPGAASFTPTWTLAESRQGLNYVNFRVADQVGNQATSNGVIVVRVDTQAPVPAGMPAVMAWNFAAPTLSGVSWQDQDSGLASGWQYSIGSTAGATNVQAWTTMPTQPTTGSWSPTWTPSGNFVQGNNYVNVRAYDAVGNLRETSGAYVIQFDAGLPAVSGNPATTNWRNTPGSLSGVTWQADLSGLQGNAQYSIGSTSGGTEVLGWTNLPEQPSQGQTTPFAPTWTPNGNLVQGTNHVNLRVSTTAGKTLTTNDAYLLRYDTASPGVIGAPATLPWSTTATANGVTLQDPLSGLQATVQYSVGATSGATNILGWTNLPTQPTDGDASFAPTWTLANVQQGLNYVNVRVTDQAGNQVTSNGAIVVRHDTATPSATGAPTTTAWSKVNPTLSGVCIQDVTGGLQAAATYVVGSAPGLSDRQGSTAMPVLPTAGQTTSWCPSFQVTSALLQGAGNHVTIHTTDQAGNSLAAQAYQIRFDDQTESVATPNILANSGGSTLPLATWQTDKTPRYEWTAPSSASPIAGYSYTLTTSNTATPDATIETTNTFLDRASSPLPDGTWYFSVRAIDQAGNAGPATTQLVLKVDATTPSVPTQSSATHPFQTRYYNATAATIAWTGSTSSSGIVGYSFDLVSGANPAALDNTVDATTTGTSYTGLGPLQAYTFRVKVLNGAGAWSPVSPFQVNVNTLPPTIGAVSPAKASLSTDPFQPVTATYNAQKGGQDPNEWATQVDPAQVQLFVDGVDVVAHWRAQPVCQGTATSAGACPLEVTTHQVTYTPVQPWTNGNHNLNVAIKDTTIPATQASMAWNFTEYAFGVVITSVDCPPGAIGINVPPISLCPDWPIDACPDAMVGAVVEQQSACIPICPDNPGQLDVDVCVPTITTCSSGTVGVQVNGFETQFNCLNSCPVGSSPCAPELLALESCPAGMVGATANGQPFCVALAADPATTCPTGKLGLVIAGQPVCVDSPGG